MKEYIPLLMLPLAFLGLIEAEKRSSGIHETPGIEEQKRMKEEEEEKEEDIERKRIENRKQYIEYLIPRWSKMEEIVKKRGRGFFSKNVLPLLFKLEGKEEVLNCLDRCLKKINEKDQKKFEEREKQKKQLEEWREIENGWRRTEKEEHRIEKQKQIEQQKQMKREEQMSKVAPTISKQEEDEKKRSLGGRPKKQVDVKRIIQMRKEGKSYREIGEELRISKDLVSSILKEYGSSEGGNTSSSGV